MGFCLKGERERRKGLVIAVVVKRRGGGRWKGRKKGRKLGWKIERFFANV